MEDTQQAIEQIQEAIQGHSQLDLILKDGQEIRLVPIRLYRQVSGEAVDYLLQGCAEKSGHTILDYEAAQYHLSELDQLTPVGIRIGGVFTPPKRIKGSGYELLAER